MVFKKSAQICQIMLLNAWLFQYKEISYLYQLLLLFLISMTKPSDRAELTQYLQDKVTTWTVTLPSPQRGAGLESLNLLYEMQLSCLAPRRALSIQSGTIYSTI